MPGAGFKRLPPGTREDLHEFLHTPFEQVKKQMVRMLCSLGHGGRTSDLFSNVNLVTG